MILLAAAETNTRLYVLVLVNDNACSTVHWQSAASWLTSIVGGHHILRIERQNIVESTFLLGGITYGIKIYE